MKLSYFYFIFLFLLLFVNSVDAVAEQFFPLPEVEVGYNEQYTFRPQYYFVGWHPLGIGISFTDETTGNNVFLNFNGNRYFENNKYAVQVYSNGNIAILSKNQRVNNKRFNIYVSSNPSQTQLVRTLFYSVSSGSSDEQPPTPPPVPPILLREIEDRVIGNSATYGLIFDNYFSNFDCGRLYFRDVSDPNNIPSYYTFDVTKCIGHETENYSLSGLNFTFGGRISGVDGVRASFTATLPNKIYEVDAVVWKGINTANNVGSHFVLYTISNLSQSTIINTNKIPNLFSYSGIYQEDLISNDTLNFLGYVCQEGVQMNICRSVNITNLTFNNFFTGYTSLNITISNTNSNILTGNKSQILNASNSFVAVKQNNTGDIENSFELFWNNGNAYLNFPDADGSFGVDYYYDFIITANGGDGSRLINNFTYIRYNQNDYGNAFERDFFGRHDISFNFNKRESRQYIVSEFFDNYEQLGVSFGLGADYWLNRCTGGSVSGSNSTYDYNWTFEVVPTSNCIGDFLLTLSSGDIIFPYEELEFLANDSTGFSLTLLTFMSVNGTSSTTTQQQEEQDTENNQLKSSSNNPVAMVVGYFSALFPDENTLSPRAKFSFVIVVLLLINIVMGVLLVYSGATKFMPYLLVIMNTILVLFFTSIGYIPWLFLILVGLILLIIVVLKLKGGGGS